MLYTFAGMGNGAAYRQPGSAKRLPVSWRPSAVLAPVFIWRDAAGWLKGFCKKYFLKTGTAALAVPVLLYAA